MTESVVNCRVLSRSRLLQHGHGTNEVAGGGRVVVVVDDDGGTGNYSPTPLGGVSLGRGRKEEMKRAPPTVIVPHWAVH